MPIDTTDINLTASTDPLERLGISLTLNILEALPLPELLSIPRLSKAYAALFESHASGIFRPACHRYKVDEEQLRHLRAIEAETPIRQADAEHSTGQGDPDDRLGCDRVDWKEELKRHIVWDRNWKKGRCEDSRIQSARQDVWRFKLDPEEDCCIMTSKQGRLEVVDTESSTPLFSIEGLRPYAHLEFANGFAVFDNGNEPMQLEVWRNRHALSRSSHPEAFGHTSSEHQPMMVEELLSSDETPDSEGIGRRYTPATLPLTRGNLSFYRHITPPRRCRAFRARVDHKNTPEERSVLCTVGNHDVYVYDLEEGTLVQHIVTHEPSVDHGNIQYVELDDDYIFLCHSKAFCIYSRQSRQLLVRSWHTRPQNVRMFVDYNLAQQQSVHAHEIDREGPNHPTVQTAKALRISRRKIRGSAKTDEVEELSIPNHGGFNACHYAEDDLVCLDHDGLLCVTRGYRSLLRISDASARERAWEDHTVALDLGRSQGIYLTDSHLATDRTHVALSSIGHVLFFDSSTLPDVCAGGKEIACICATNDDCSATTGVATTASPSSVGSADVTSSADVISSAASNERNIEGPVLHFIAPNSYRDPGEVSCLQVDKDNICVKDNEEDDCVRVLNFAPEE